MATCRKCGALFVPEPLLDKIHLTFTDDYLNLCQNCRKTNVVDLYRRMTPWVRKQSNPAHGPKNTPVHLDERTLK
jgi:hypothetical protein